MNQSVLSRTAMPTHAPATLERAPESCSQCLGWKDSLEKVEQVLHGDYGACGGCTHHAEMHIVSQQYMMRLPRWWAVNGKQVVPIWLVDRIKKKFHF